MVEFDVHATIHKREGESEANVFAVFGLLVIGGNRLLRGRNFGLTELRILARLASRHALPNIEL
ncbi:hypothetical protein D3C84_955840 [compost metagenome]